MSDLNANYHRQLHQLYHLHFCEFTGKVNQPQGMKATFEREVWYSDLLSDSFCQCLDKQRVGI
jgi:hypothetical protein